MVEERKNVAVLVGNGLSIAFNPDLKLQSITEEVMSRIEGADGGDVIRAMQEIASRALPDGASSADDFESLVGAFGAESRTLSLLDKLATLSEPGDEELRKAIVQVSKFAEKVRDNGVSHVLEVIAERSHAFEWKADGLHSTVSAIVEAFDGEVYFGNLNYDTLLLAGLLTVCQPDLADMGHGYKTATVLVDESEPREVQQLRRSASEFPPGRRVKLLHLHGSLAYWATEDSSSYVKIPVELLSDGGQWSAMRNLTTNIRPVVVLANRRDKSEHVEKFPFSLAYEMFGDGLRGAEHWLIVGYSFKDDPVNAALREEFISRKSKPRVLVVTQGDLPLRGEVERALGWGAENGSSKSWLAFHRDGADRFHENPQWELFKA